MLSLRQPYETEEFSPPYGFKERFLYFSLVQVNLACTELILKEANSANEGFSK